jgi:hypothetical protein
LLRMDVVWPVKERSCADGAKAHRKWDSGRMTFCMREYQRGNLRCICAQCDNTRIKAFRGRWFPRLMKNKDWIRGRLVKSADSNKKRSCHFCQ